MKSLALFVLLFSPFLSQAQSATAGRFSIGVTIAPELSYRHVNASDSTGWIKDISNDVDIQKFGYSTGANILYSISSRLSVESGAFYTNKGWKTKEVPLINEYVQSPSNGPGPVISGSIRAMYSFNYLDIPLKVNYVFLNKRVKLFATAGIVADIFLSSKRTAFITEYGKERKSSVTDNNFNSLSLSATAGIGAAYSFTRHLSLRVAPTYTRMLTPILNAPDKYYLWSAGLNIGVVYNLQHR